MKHVIRAQQFNRKEISTIFETADAFASGKKSSSMAGRIMATLFYEPSTRTRLSFEAAMMRLGGTVLSSENPQEFSSVAKGETLSDTIRVVAGFCDVIVLRHKEEGSAAQAAEISPVPVINAGDGAVQHPTQALLDLYTIQRELGRVDGITIVMAGDLLHGRTVRSLAYMLGKYREVKIVFVSPEELRIGQDILDYLDRHRVRYEESGDLSFHMRQADVVYQTRIQQERFKDLELYRKLKGVYQIDRSAAELMKPRSIIMHPLPRVDEILPEVDSLPHAAYFRQAQYGLYVRMALLHHIFSSR